MSSNRGHTLVELMVAMVISILILSFLTWTFNGLQKTIWKSQQIINQASDVELILELLRRDIRNVVHPSLSSPVQWSNDQGKADVFLCNIPGYQGDRKVTMVGYQFNRKGGKTNLIRKDRSIQWDHPSFGFIGTKELGIHPLDNNPLREWIQDPGEVISEQILDFVFYYHYRKSGEEAIVITTKPDSQFGDLRCITSFVVFMSPPKEEISALLSRVEVLFGKEEYQKKESFAGAPLPWIQRFEAIQGILSAMEKKELKLCPVYRSVEVSWP